MAKVYIVYAEVTVRGAWMPVKAESASEAREIASTQPNFSFSGVHLEEFNITEITQSPLWQDSEKGDHQ